MSRLNIIFDQKIDQFHNQYINPMVNYVKSKFYWPRLRSILI
jgi:hypothetical protein